MTALASPSTRRTYHQCARCGKRQTVDQMVYSTHTRNHYCSQIDSCARPSQIDSCARRARRVGK